MDKLNLRIIFTFFIAFVILNVGVAQTQSTSNQIAIKEWLIANKGRVTLVLTTEYQKMSPDIRSVLDANQNTLVYAQQVTLEDVRSFEEKSKKAGMTYVAFQTEKEKLEAVNTSAEGLQTEEENVAVWLEANRKFNIKIISRKNYESRPAKERAYIDKLKDKIIYMETLKWEDIQNYEKGK